jgi:hypothetical protein
MPVSARQYLESGSARGRSWPIFAEIAAANFDRNTLES